MGTLIEAYVESVQAAERGHWSRVYQSDVAEFSLVSISDRNEIE